MRARPHRPEVLAPAGSPDALRAALQSGADAVYFGLQDGFNARARAANFSLATLAETVAAIHRAGARAYVTLNTLVFEPELPAIERVLRAVAASGVDALIVQDPAVCLLARAVCPELELHASTQMTVASPRGAAFARELGVTRVVVPRELSLPEIERFAAGTDLELEVFVHGALCVAWSGQCLTSEAWGGRSANRGQCAQSCRMPYELVVDGRRVDLGDVRYLLSPQDLAGAPAVPELVRIGVHGLKIEGRQKGVGYVATATAGYRRWVDALVAGDDPRAAQRQLAEDLLAMSLSYTRGFGAGFLLGSDHQTLVEGRFPKHRGVYLGRVRRVQGDAVLVERDGAGRPWTGGLGLAAAGGGDRGRGPAGERTVDLAEAAPVPVSVRAGMGVVFDQGRPEDPDEPGGPVFRVREDGDRIELGFGSPGPDLARVRPGDRVWVTADPALQQAAERSVRGAEPDGRVPARLTVAGGPGAPLRAQLQTGGFAATATSAVPLQPARGRGLDAALLRDKLGALGGTPFRLEGLDCTELAPGLHLPPGELKELRRRLVAELLPRIERGPARTLDPAPALPRVRAALAAGPDAAGSDGVRSAAPALVPLVRSEAQLDAVIDLGLPEVELDWMEFVGLGKAHDRARAAGLRTVVATPRIGKPGEEAIDERIARLAPDGVLVRHWGAMMRCLEQRRDTVGGGDGVGRTPALHGDFSLNVTNSLTLAHLLRLGLDTVTASFDLDQDQLFALLQNAPASRLAVVVHHRIPTFHTEHCVYSHLLSNGRDFRSCGRPCERHQVSVRDHQGREHPVIVDVGCRNTVFHHAPQQAAAWADGLRRAGVARFRLEFVREGRGEVGAVVGAWRDLLAGRIDAAELGARTGAGSHFGVAVGGMRLLGE